MKSFTNLFILFFILIVLGVLYKRFEDKRIREEEGDTYEAIQKYLSNLDAPSLGQALVSITESASILLSVSVYDSPSA